MVTVGPVIVGEEMIKTVLSLFIPLTLYWVLMQEWLNISTPVILITKRS